MLSIFLRVQLSVLRIAKSHNEISCSAWNNGSYAVSRITIGDVIEKLRPINSHVVYIFAPTALSFENSKKLLRNKS